MWDKKYILISILLSLGTLILLLIHWFFPSIEIDTITLILLFIIILPWLLPFIKSIEIPNIFKIETKDVKAATEKIKEAKDVTIQLQALKLKAMVNPINVIANVKDPIVSLKIIGKNEPELAMVGFRIEIEKRIFALVELVYGDVKKQSMVKLVRKLIHDNIIDHNFASGLLDLIAFGNKAAHGIKVSKSAIDFVLNEGALILGMLDTIIEQIKQENET